MKEDTKTFIKQMCSFSLQILTYLLAISVLIITIGLLISIERTPTTAKHVEVYDSVSGEVLWTYEGNCYLTERKNAGNYTLTFCREDGTTGRADFVGDTINILVVDK